MHAARPIIVIGSINRDIIVRCGVLPREGETVRGHSLGYGGGGKGANQAFAAARLGGDVRMIGRVGSDAYGRAARATLRSVGCNITGIRQAGQMSGQALVLVDDVGANSIVVIGGANDLFLPDGLRRDALLLQAGGLVLLQLELPLDTVAAAAETVKKARAQIILDPAPAQPMPESLLRQIDILTPNRTELCELVGVAQLSADELVEAADQLRASGPRVVIVKMGSEGCLVVEEGKATHMPASLVAAIDTTGAGDVFNAALAVALAQGAATITACEFALAAASLSVTRSGAQAAAPDRAEVDAFIKGTAR